MLQFSPSRGKSLYFWVLWGPLPDLGGIVTCVHAVVGGLYTQETSEMSTDGLIYPSFDAKAKTERVENLLSYYELVFLKQSKELQT